MATRAVLLAVGLAVAGGLFGYGVGGAGWACALAGVGVLVAVAAAADWKGW